jgi:hypothetical protein
LKGLIIVALMLIVSGCGTMTTAYTAFDGDLERLAGKKVDDSYIFNLGYLRDNEPSEIQELVSANQIYTYKIEFRTRPYPFAEPTQIWRCTVKIEVEAQSKVIKSATSRGEGCWRSV